MSKIIIKKEDGVEKVKAIVEFDLGVLVDESKNPDNTISMGMGVNGMEAFYKQVLFEKAESGDMNFNEWQEQLEQYIQFVKLKMIGVEEFPIKRNREGKIEGVDESVIIIDGGTKKKKPSTHIKDIANDNE